MLLGPTGPAIAPVSRPRSDILAGEIPVHAQLAGLSAIRRQFVRFPSFRADAIEPQMAATGRSDCRFALNLMETIMQTFFGLDEMGTRQSLVTAARRAALMGAALSALVAAAGPGQAQSGSPLHSGIGHAAQQGTFPHSPSTGVKCLKKGQTFTFPIATTDAPGVLSTTWSVVPPSGIASVAGTNADPAWVTPPSGISWEQAVTPPPIPANPINELAGPTPFIFSASFGPLPPPGSVSITVTGVFSADNDGSVWINGVPANLTHLAHQAGYCPPTYGPPPAGYGAKCFVTTFPLSTPSNAHFHAGMNTVDVRVHNNEFVSGFMLDGIVTATCIK